MTQAINSEQTLIEKLQSLTPQQQQTVLDFIEFLQSQNQPPQVQEFKHPDGTPMSAYEAAKKYAGCVDGGPGDLSTNKKYLEGIGWKSEE